MGISKRYYHQLESDSRPWTESLVERFCQVVGSVDQAPPRPPRKRSPWKPRKRLTREMFDRMIAEAQALKANDS